MFFRLASPLARVLFARFGRSFAHHKNQTQIADARLYKAAAEALETRTLLASVTGYVYNDFDADRVRGASEPGVAGIEVILGGFDDGPRTTTTDSAGQYEFTGIAAGLGLGLSVGYHDPYTLTTDEGVTVIFTDDGAFTGPDFGVSMASTASGVISMDQDGNGVFTPGDGGIGGITLFGDTNHNGQADAGEPLAVSDPSGAFDIGNLLPGGVTGTIQVRVLPPAGWQPATPGGDLIEFPVGGNPSNLNIVLSPSAFGLISGTVFDDQNQDGAANEGVGVGGVAVLLVAPNGWSMSTTTDADGHYTFGGLTPRTYSLSVTVPSNWSLSTANPISASVTSASPAIAGRDFGLYLSSTGNEGSIFGTIWDDHNANGVKDPGDDGLPLVSIYATEIDDSKSDFGAQYLAETGANGVYNFGGLLVGGSYQVSVTIAGRRPTTGWGNSNVYTITESNLSIPGIDQGWTRGTINVGAVDMATFYGVVGLDITMTGPDGTATYPASSGNLTLTDLDPYASYTFTASGATYRSFGPVTVTPAEGENLTVTANPTVVYAPGSATGVVFEDINNNGAQDEGETGQDGWTFFVDENNNQVQDPGEPSAVSGANGTPGEYTVPALFVGTTQTLRLAGFAGWHAPAGSTADVYLGGGSDVTRTGVNLAVRKLPTITIEKVQDGSEDPDVENLEEGPKPVIFELTRTGYADELSDSLSVALYYGGNTGTSDFLNLPPAITFANQELSTRLIYQVDDDILEEGSETLEVSACIAESSLLVSTNSSIADNDFAITGITVDFDSSAYLQNIKTETGVVFDGPHWVDLNNDYRDDRESSYSEGEGEPIVLRTVTGTPGWLAHVTLETRNLPLTGSYEIRGIGDVGTSFVFDWGLATINGTTLTADLISDITDRAIDSYGESVQWFVRRLPSSTAPASAPIFVDLSFNHVFVTAGDANGAYDSEVSVGCESAKGIVPTAANARTSIISAIWNTFLSRNVNTVRGPQLHYYNGSGPGGDGSVSSLLQYGRGTCQAWAIFYRDTLSAQGITDSIPILITPPVTASYFFPNGDRGVAVLSARAQGTGSTIYQIPGKPAHLFGNNNVVTTLFNNHVQVWLDGVLYDPSYGSTTVTPTGLLPASELSWEASNLAGFVQLLPTGTVIDYARTNASYLKSDGLMADWITITITTVPRYQ